MTNGLFPVTPATFCGQATSNTPRLQAF